MAGLNLLAQISDRSPFDLCKIACDHAHSFTHQKGLSYEIFEIEDSGLPQQGILPISAKKNEIYGGDL